MLIKYRGAQIRLGARLPLTEDQRIIARNMLQSKREIPCFYLTVRADVTELEQLRSRLNHSHPRAPKISCDDFIIRAVSSGLEKYPVMTGQLVDDTIKLAERINIALAVSVEDRYDWLVVEDANKKDVAQIAREREGYSEDSKFPPKAGAACITISNLGQFGVETFIPIVVPGQCSVLGIGRIMDLPAVNGPGESITVVRKLMNMTLSVDHKVTNGAYAAQFLDFVRKQLENTSTYPE